MISAARKPLLALHLVASMGWIGALAVFLAHALVSVTSADTRIVAAACLAMGVAAWFVILPMAAATLATGLIQAIGTAWGLARHYWILFKLVLTVVATAVLLLKLGPIDDLARSAADAGFSLEHSTGQRASLLVHAIGGLAILLGAALLAVYKPRGLTPFPIPSWVRASLVGLGILAALLLVMLVAGGHGPRSHWH